MITVRKVITQDATDILNDTELKVMPFAGVLEIYAASSQNDTNITIFKNDKMVVFSKPLIQREGGVPDAVSDTPYELDVLEGENIRIDIDINTGAIVVVEATLKGLEEV